MRGAAAVVMVGVFLAGLAPAPMAGADAASLAGVKLVLDPGHGGSDPGAQGLGLREADVNLDVALRARDLLEAEGATVLLTRDCDCTTSLAARVALANGEGAHRFVSVHSNACGGCGGHGTETYYHTSLGPGSTAAALAGQAQGELVEHLGLRDRGVKQADFYVLRETSMPAILVELGFVDHAGDNAVLADAAKRQEAARALLHALHLHYGVAPHDPGPPPAFDVRLLRPADGAWVRGSVVVEAVSTQEQALAWMRLLVDGQVVKWVTPAPHAWTWDTPGWADGGHAVAVEARNVSGVQAFASVKSLVDNTPPEVALTAPRPGMLHVGSVALDWAVPVTVAAGLVPVQASASDPAPGSGLARVVFSVDGVPRFTDDEAPFAWDWPARSESLGHHMLGATAHDTVGNARTDLVFVELTAPTTAAGVLATLDRYA